MPSEYKDPLPRWLKELPKGSELSRRTWLEIKYRDLDWHKEKRKFMGFEAEIVQHELDHLEGKLV